jgi:hypothetical protein
MMVLLFVWRARISNNLAAFLTRDLFAPFLLSFLAPVVWSILDFQGYPDFFVFLPYFATSFSWLLLVALETMHESKRLGHSLARIAFWLVCAVLIGISAHEYRMTSETGLVDQLQWAQEIESKYLAGDNDGILSIGRPEILVLLDRTNQNRHIVINSGEHKLIEATSPGGLDSWLDVQMDADPAVVVLGSVSPSEVKARIANRLKSYGLARKRVGSWVLYVRDTNDK